MGLGTEIEKFLGKIDYKILKIYGNQWENAQKSLKKFDINKSLNGKALAKEISNPYLYKSFRIQKTLLI